MKAVMVMYDSLDKHFLSPYGYTWTHTPNFARLAEKATLYNEVANIPFFLYDPRCACPKSCDALCQTVDIAPTLLEYFGVNIPGDMMGKPLNKAYRDGEKLRDWALYGVRMLAGYFLPLERSRVL